MSLFSRAGNSPWLHASLTLALTCFSGVNAQTEGSPGAEVAVSALLAATKAELEQLPAEPAPESVDARYRAAITRRLGLVEELAGVESRTADLEAEAKNIEARLEQADVQLKRLAEQPAPTLGATTTREGFDVLSKAVSSQRAVVTKLAAGQAESRRRLDEGIPKLLEEARVRLDEATKRAQSLSEKATAVTDTAERRVLLAQAQNAEIDARVARRTVDALEAEARLLPRLEPVRGRELDAAQRRLARLEAQYELYGEALEGMLAQKRARADADLARRERAAAEAETPRDRFLARWDAKLAVSERSRGQAESQLIARKQEVGEQEKRLAAEKDELTALEDLINRSGTSGLAGQRIQTALRQIRERRRLIGRALKQGLAESLEEYRARRFEVEDQLFGLIDRFAAEREEVLAQIPAAERIDLRANADQLIGQLRDSLRDEQSKLTELIGLSQGLQTLLVQRLGVLNQLERFVRARAFWLRDGRPLGLDTVKLLTKELNALGAWAADAAPRAPEVLRRELQTGLGVLVAVLLFPVLPIGLFFIRQRLRKMTRRVNDRVVSEGRRPALLALTVLTGALSALAIPIYFLVAASLVESAELPASLDAVLGDTLRHTAVVLLLWFLARSFFARRSIAEVQFAMPRPAANGLYRTLGWLVFGYAVALAPAAILNAAPFGYQAFPRVLHTVFLLCAATAVILLVRPRGPFVQHALEQLGSSWITHRWSVAGRVLMALTVLIVALDVIGYRYASRSMGESLLATLVVIFVLPIIYRWLTSATARARDALAERSAVSDETENQQAGVNEHESAIADEDASGEEATEEIARAHAMAEEAEIQAQATARFQRYIRLGFIVVAVVVLLGLWGIDEQALKTLDDFNFYAVNVAGADPEFVTAGDLVRAVLFIVAMFWILRALPGLYQVALFPRLRVDEGIKYATLTISRYTIFVIGLFLALAELHLDLGRLGWLMAAVGVGLGFGLQEIVSNFVSGIILLIERPVRPGDIVSVGNMSGTVQRINIRATTILNYDRQEVMVPNRSLITSEVINWTRGDTISRAVIRIGVAYGSDVSRVTELLFEIAREQPMVMEEPAPQVFFMAHGESSLDFELRVFVPAPSERLKATHAINQRISAVFAESGIEIPFPQRDLHIRSTTGVDQSLSSLTVRA